ncbi:PaaI family thioesterase [Marinobacter sp.]|uniref:PaaI family thioesterase n=1 Tax=Marinobacter sp. TaxID=50741 RepID=UPI0034A5C201
MKAQNEQYLERTQKSFDRQAMMKTLGAELSVLAPGKVEIRFPYNPKFTQQNDYLHAGIVTTIMDSACGYAAFTLMPPDADVLTVEFKVNLLRPAKGEVFTSSAVVLKPGKTISVVEALLYSPEYGEQGDKPVASMTATIMTMI